MIETMKHLRDESESAVDGNEVDGNEEVEEAGQVGDEEVGEGGERGVVCWPKVVSDS